MELKIKEFVWELTERCNLHCKHCGSDCTSSYKEELSLEDALRVVEELEPFSIGRIVFSGGEPLLCPYWRELAKAFHRRTELGMVTNGTLMTEKTAQELKEYGFLVVSVSVDGLEESHDGRRGKGSFRQCMDALELIKNAGLVPAVNTTVTKEILTELPLLQQRLRESGVVSWQIQPAVHSGRMNEYRESLLSTDDIWSLIHLAYRSNSHGSLPTVFLAETIGYYSVEETLARKMAYDSKKLPVWKGCPAGINTMAILSTGELTGCIALRAEQFRERNVTDLWREGMTIADYWKSPDAFKWRRNFRSEMLRGKCSGCKYASYCLGGCSNVRYCSHKTLSGDNPFCVYAAEAEKFDG